MDGWIKLHRSILQSRQFQDVTELKAWVWMMCKASFSDRLVKLKIGKGFKTVSIKRGQFIFGRNAAYKETGIEPSTIYRILQRFSEDGCITVESNNQYSIVTLNHFEEHQSSEDDDFFEIEEFGTTNEQPLNNQRTTNEQPMDSQWTANEQVMNTVEECLEGKEGSEKKEGGKSEEGSGAAGAIPQVPAEAEPFVLTPPPPADLPPGGARPPSEKKARRAATPRKTKHLFTDSPYFDLQVLKQGFFGSEFPDADAEYYHRRALDWTTSSGGKYMDWLSGLLGWIRKDIDKTGSYHKIKTHSLNNGTEQRFQQPSGPAATNRNGRDARTANEQSADIVRKFQEREAARRNSEGGFN